MSAASPAPPPAAPTSASPAIPTAGNRPWVLGPHRRRRRLGYNYQFANKWVVGVEGDIGGANVHGGRSAGTNVVSIAGITSAFFSLQDKTNWMATATGRLGYAWGRTLLYVKGGAAFEDGRHQRDLLQSDRRPRSASRILRQPGRRRVRQRSGFGTSSTRVGWTIGFGTEFDLGHNWSAKAEYDYISFGSHTALASDGTTIMTDRA